MASALLLLIATAAQAADVVGKVGYMSGSLMVQCADGTIKVIGPKSDVLAGDTLITAKDSYAQVKMIDGAKMTLRPNSNFKIEAYRFNKQEPKADNAILHLFKGGLRTFTGLIGKRGDPDAYKLRAAGATLRIRGTDFSSRLCATANCQDDMAASARSRGNPQAAPSPAAGTTPTAAPAAPPGLYVTVHTGQVVMAQAGNQLNLGRGETGFANQTALIKLPAPPAFMKADEKQTSAIEAKASKAEKKEAAAQPDSDKADGKTEEGKASDQPDDKPAEEETGGTPDGESDAGSGELDSINGGTENADSLDPSISQSGCVVQYTTVRLKRE